MAFDLKTTLRVLLFASPGPLTVSDIQRVFGRFHERQEELAREAEEEANRLESEAAARVQAPGAATDEQAQAATLETSAAAEAEATPEPSVATGDQQLVLPGIRPGRLPSDVPTLITGTQIRDALREVEADLRAANEVYTLREGPQGYRLHTLPEHAEWVRCLRDEPPPIKLTQSNLETLAVIAYRQPATRSEIEAIRGVSCENSVNKLLDRNLIRITGRADLPGRPIQYGTTEAFLDFAGVKSLSELPASDVLSRREVDAWLEAGANSKRIEDSDVGLPGLEAELAAAGAAVTSGNRDETKPPGVEEPALQPQPPTVSSPTHDGSEGTAPAN